MINDEASSLIVQYDSASFQSKQTSTFEFSLKLPGMYLGASSLTAFPADKYNNLDFCFRPCRQVIMRTGSLCIRSGCMSISLVNTSVLLTLISLFLGKPAVDGMKRSKFSADIECSGLDEDLLRHKPYQPALHSIVNGIRAKRSKNSAFKIMAQWGTDLIHFGGDTLAACFFTRRCALIETADQASNERDRIRWGIVSLCKGEGEQFLDYVHSLDSLPSRDKERIDRLTATDRPLDLATPLPPGVVLSTKETINVTKLRSVDEVINQPYQHPTSIMKTHCL